MGRLLVILCVVCQGYSWAPVRSVASRSVALRSGRTSGSEEAEEAEAAKWTRARLGIGALASAGFAETSYLTASKLSAASQAASAAVCRSRECSAVLSGPWSQFGGVPLSALGVCAYLAVCALALSPLAAQRAGVGGERLEQLERDSRFCLVLATSAMAVFSACLVALLLLKLKTTCELCFASASLCAAMAALALTQAPQPSAESRARPALAGAAAAALAALVFFAATESGIAMNDARALVATGDVPVTLSQKQGPKKTGVFFSPPTVETQSSQRALRLATHLGTRGDRMFGAYWCSHCFSQKELFGATALPSVKYVECAADGANNERALCQSRGIAGYPTWEIGGELFPGEKTIEELETLSGLGKP